MAGRWLSLLRGGATVAAALVLGGCASAVGLSDLALDYNESASRSNDQLLLLNILRASHRAPYQFTALQTVNGANDVNASLDLGIAPSGRSGMVMLGARQTSTLTDTFLDTREFYNGMSTSIPGPIINNFFHDSPSNAILANLFFDRITIGTPSTRGCRDRPHSVACEVTFHNAPRNGRDFALFQYVLQQMFAAGLSTEAIRIQRKDDGKAYRPDNEVMVPDDVRFCFRTTLSHMSLIEAKREAQCRSIDAPKEKLGSRASPISVGINRIFANKVHDIIKETSTGDEKSDADSTDESIENTVDSIISAGSIEVEIHVRSTLHVIEYLGEIASTEITGKPTRLVRSSESRTGSGDRGESCVLNTADCEPLFVVRRGAAPGDIAVRYRGEVFSVPDGPEGYTSNEVLAVVRQLVALSTSSKAFPAPSVLTLVP